MCMNLFMKCGGKMKKMIGNVNGESVLGVRD